MFNNYHKKVCDPPPPFFKRIYMLEECIIWNSTHCERKITIFCEIYYGTYKYFKAKAHGKFESSLAETKVIYENGVHVYTNLYITELTACYIYKH